MSSAGKDETVPDVGITKTASVSSATHEDGQGDEEVAIAPVPEEITNTGRRNKLLLVCLISCLLVVAAVVTVTAVVLSTKRSTSPTQQDGFNGEVLNPTPTENEQEDEREQQGGKEEEHQADGGDPSATEDDETEETANTEDAFGDGEANVEPVIAHWTTPENALPPGEDEEEEVYPLLSLGNFTGLGDVMALEMESWPAKIYFGNPVTGCVTVMKQVGGWSLPDMWVWNVTDIRGAPPAPQWEQIGEAICKSQGFGAHVAHALDFVDWDDFDFSESDPEAWNDLVDQHENGGASFVASNPNDGTASFYSYDLGELGWILRQTIESPEGYDLWSLQAEEDFLTISYTPTTASREITNAQVHVYQAAADVEKYDRVGEETSFMGVDVDSDSSGYVATLGSDRTVRAYYNNGAEAYHEVGKPFEPALVLNDVTLFEEDLKIIKLDAIDVIVSAAIVNAGSEGKKTIGIGSYHYIDPNWKSNPCFGTSYYPDRCDDLLTDIWDPGYHGAAEFVPVSTVSPTQLMFNSRGTAAAVATKSGFTVFSPFNVPFPVDYAIDFDSGSYLSHDIAYVSSWGLVSILVEPQDGSSAIQSYMMAGV